MTQYNERYGWHTHHGVHTHAHPGGGTASEHDHPGWTLVMGINEPARLMASGVRMPGETTPLEALHNQARQA